MARQKKNDNGAPAPTTDEQFQTVLAEFDAIVTAIEGCVATVEPHRTTAGTAISGLKAAFRSAIKKATGQKEAIRRTAVDDTMKALTDIAKYLKKALDLAKGGQETVAVSQIGLKEIVDAAERATQQVKQLAEAKNAKKKADAA